MENFRKNTAFTFFSNISLLILSLIFSILLNRSLGPKLKGIYTFYITIPLLLNALLSFGLESANVYFIGKRKIMVNKLISNSLYVYSTIFLIMLFIFFIIFHFGWFQYTKGYTENRFLLFLSIIATPLIMENTFLSTITLGLQKYKLFNILRNIQIFFLILSIIICIYIFKFTSIRAFFLLWILSILISISMYVFTLRKHINMVRFDLPIFKETMKYSFKNYIANLSTFLIYRSDYFVISIFLPPQFLGFYSVATVISEKMWLIPSSIATILYPKVSNLKKYEKKTTIFSLKINFILMMVLGIILAIIAYPLIKLLYGKAYIPAANIILYLLPGIIFLSIPKMLTADLNGQGHPEFSAIYSFIGFIFNLLLNIILIPKYGIIGAAISTSFGYIYISIMIAISYKKLSKCNWLDFIINKNDIKTMYDIIKL